MSEAKTEFEQRVAADDFNKAVQECLRQKSNAAEYVGNFGQIKKLTVERLGAHQKAFADHLRLRLWESSKRREYIRSLLQYELLDPAGPFAQLDAFDDLNIILESILDGAVNPPERATDNVVVLDALTAAE